MGQVSTCLWFDGQAEDAAKLYTSLVPNSRITQVVPYSDAGPGTPGTAMVVSFELDGAQYIGLNGGPAFTFSEAASVHILCRSQEEIDKYWQALTAGGGSESQCGWLKDKYGLSWQIDSAEMHDMLASDDRAAAARAMEAMLTMKKLDVGALRQAFNGA